MSDTQAPAGDPPEDLLAALKHPPPNWSRAPLWAAAEIERQRDTIARLEAERDAARVDADRYRWLRDTHPADPESLWVARGLPQTGLSCWRYEALDAAIDAAIRAAKGEA